MAKIFYNENELVFAKKPIHGNFKDLTGKSFHRLTVIGLSNSQKAGSSWFCRCSCGNITKVKSEKLASGKTKSCGCLRIEQTIERVTTHGHTRNNNISAEYIVWCSMLARTQNPKNSCFNRYGGRGIKVCERWMKFENFFADMGEKPAELSIDRIDVNGNYEPSNCRWATVIEQANNRRDNRKITHNGVTKNLNQWANDVGINRATIDVRLKFGWSIEEALTKPVKKYNFKIP